MTGPTPSVPALPVRPPEPAGLVLAPFRGLRFAASAPADIGQLTSPPYDVIDDDEARGLADRHPHNIVRLILPRDRPGEPGSRYRRAGQTLADWRAGGVLRADPTPALYVYEESGSEHTQRGLLGAVALVTPEAGVILPHENTMAGPVADRLALTEATQANTEPIMLVYDGGGAASGAVATAEDTGPPLVDTVTDDGYRHRLWALRAPQTLAEIAADLLPRRAVIADGHHRYATYLRYQADRHAAGHGAGPWDNGLALLVDATAFGPQVHAIHRVLPGLPLMRAVELAAAGFNVEGVDTATTEPLAALAASGKRGPAFLLAAGGQRYLLTDPDRTALDAALPADRSPAWRELDVTIAHRLLIEKLWQLPDNEEVVGYRHDAVSALAAADLAGGTALLLNPTPVDSVIAVAAAGERMPRKSTLFTPKPRTGIVLRDLRDDNASARAAEAQAR